MFVSHSTHQEALDTIKNLNIQLDETEFSRTRMRETLELAHTLDNQKQDQARDASLIAKDHKITELENKIERMESELDARLKLQEDIHLDELIAVEAKFEAKKEAIEIAYQAKEAALKTQTEAANSRAYAERDKIIAAAERQALENIQNIYKNTLEVLVEKMKQIPTMSPSEITELINAATENYPTLPKTLTSTSSSK
jgi:hypothetical protein